MRILRKTKPRLKNDRYIPPLARITLRAPEACVERLATLEFSQQHGITTQVEIVQLEHDLWQFRITRWYRSLSTGYIEIAADGTLMEWTQQNRTRLRGITRANPRMFVINLLILLAISGVVFLLGFCLYIISQNPAALLLIALILPLPIHILLLQSQTQANHYRHQLVEEINELVG